MSHRLDEPAFVASLAMFAGVLAQIVARHLNVPGIVLLLVSGVVLGPDVANVIRPAALGHGLQGIVGIAVAVILFDGGLNLNLRVLRTQHKPIQRLVIIGSLVTTLGGAAAAHFFLGWDWRRAFLFGTLVIVTGPTVITPILRRIHVRHSVETILEAEGVFIDAVGATVAVVALDVLIVPPAERMGAGVVGILARFGIGTVTGLLGGAAFALAMRFRRVIPEGLANVAALVTAIVVFATSNAIVPESGITAVILAGMVVGHTRSHDLGELRDFKEQLTVLLVATLFVLLAADVRLGDIRALGMRGFVTMLALVLLVRPLNVFLCTSSADIEVREKLFLSWLAPRGIVAAAVSSLFAERMGSAGIAGGSAMRALVFLVIATTVVVQGMSAGLVASLLGLRQPRDAGYAILGAHEMARYLGASLRRGGEEVVFIDSNADAARAAEEEGFKVVFGDGLDERTLFKARVETRRACVGATPNESINFLFAKKVHERARDVGTFVAVERTDGGVSEEMVSQGRSRVLFAGARELDDWRSSAGRGRVRLERWAAGTDAPADEPSFGDLPLGAALPLTVSRGERVLPLERRYESKKDDIVELAVLDDHGDMVESWLSDRGWTRVVPTEAHSPPTADTT